MKKIIPMMLMMAAPLMGVAQNKSGIKPENLDKNVRPQDDFYMFVTGGWQKLNPLPHRIIMTIRQSFRPF